ncbi:sulfate transporter CysZ [Methylohalobius crimeensis]|uniref:sulfate transporter CysZ n=1 Tax=Methylohalobius crimeensis TaxID=244365 RepID=UPI0003B6366E|nr:sulfate transporter CysZ [Methylohalobius crimeensis]
METFAYDTKKLNNPVYALRCLGQGMALLGRPQLRKFVLIPLFINLILFAGAFTLAGYFFADFLDWLIPGWLDFLRWLLWPLFGLAFILITFFSFTLVANLLASPFYDKLAERTEELLTGIPPQPPEKSFAKAVIREMGAESRRLAYFVLRAIPLAILTLIPGVNLIAPFLWLLFNAWFMGLEYTAYPLANHDILFPEQRALLAKVRLGNLTVGGVVMFGVGVPLLNIVMPPAAVIAATVYFVNARRD